ncbi:hypothetical protein ACH4OY_30945 [Micromonospora rubida]|uniref:Uncharacterized protein n=1 Tax=Micromonospora rubida TaxID=2697657 RepID=A0ABW7SVW8_9ACTN
MLAGLNPEHGRRLAALPCDLVWATTWMAEAIGVLAPRLGLPRLPVVDWPDDEDDNGRLHWKTRRLAEWAAGRPFVWVDDEIAHADRTWVATTYNAPGLLHRVDPGRGLLVVGRQGQEEQHLPPGVGGVLDGAQRSRVVVDAGRQP